MRVSFGGMTAVGRWLVVSFFFVVHVATIFLTLENSSKIEITSRWSVIDNCMQIIKEQKYNRTGTGIQSTNPFTKFLHTTQTRFAQSIIIMRLLTHNYLQSNVKGYVIRCIYAFFAINITVSSALLIYKNISFVISRSFPPKNFDLVLKTHTSERRRVILSSYVQQ